MREGSLFVYRILLFIYFFQLTKGVIFEIAENTSNFAGEK